MLKNLKKYQERLLKSFKIEYKRYIFKEIDFPRSKTPETAKEHSKINLKEVGKNSSNFLIIHQLETT